MIDSPIDNPASVQQFLSFILELDEYAVDILSVKEIRGWEPVTQMPNTPDYVKGFINLRGAMVPVIDMRERFNLELREYTKATVVIILNIEPDKSDSEMVGIVVDAVSEVYSIQTEDIQQAPKLAGHIDAEYISGIVEVGEKNIILTDVLSLLNTRELIEVTKQT